MPQQPTTKSYTPSRLYGSPYKAKPLKSTTNMINPSKETYQSHDSDMTLTSSDGYVFKVRKCNFIAVSPLLGVGQRPDQPTSLSFLRPHTFRPHIRDNPGVALLLDFIYGERFLKPPPDCFKHLVNVVKIMTKYETNGPMEYYKLVLRAWAADTAIFRGKLESFAAASHMSDVETCFLALQRGGGSGPNYNQRTNIAGNILNTAMSVYGLNTFDMAGASEEQIGIIPPMYLTALLRVTKGNLGHDGDWSIISRNFRSIVIPAFGLWTENVAQKPVPVPGP